MLKPAGVLLLATLVVLSLSVEWSAAQAPAKATDFCALLTAAEAGETLGAAVSETKPETPQGSLLGGCKYGSSSGVVTLMARPAREFDASVKAYKDLKTLDGTGANGFFSPTVGMLLSQPGKPYFIHVMIAGPGPKTSERFLAIAKKILAKG
jgi:hypothetical protein